MLSPMKDAPLPTWVERLVSQVCSARTCFSSFVRCYISSCRQGRVDALATVLFPIPAPDLSVWLDSPMRRSQRKRLEVAYVKMLHLVVAALNFQFFRNPISVVDLCRRRPGAHHVALYSRLLAHIKACGCSGMVSISGCGRKSFQLDARMTELLRCVQSLGLDVRGPYKGGGPACVPVPKDDSVKEELRPYRNLDADRLKLSGCGQWNCEEYLPDLLYMPFLEPRCNVYEIPISKEDAPDNSHNDFGQMTRLLKVWDANNLLEFIPTSLAPTKLALFTKVFNNYKDESKDRQIGDRRGQNYVEGRIQCSSQHLPTSQTLLQLSPSRYKEVLTCSITDRKDFYHQFSISWEKTSLNAIYPWPRLSQVSELNATARFADNFLKRKKNQRPREVFGDDLGGKRRSLLVGEDPLMVPCFRSLFQGDHLGVEVATAAHTACLQEAGLLKSGSRLISGGFITSDDVNDGLVIDDYFCFSRERLSDFSSGDGSSTRSFAAVATAKERYREEGIRGSEEKDVLGALKYKVVGAEVDSSIPAVSRGIVSIAAPGQKRLGLAMLSAILANQKFTSDSLHACLVGSWTSILLYRRPLMSVLNALYKVIPPAELNTEDPRLWHLSREAAQELLLLACLAPVVSANLAMPFSPKIYATDASLAKGGFCYAWIEEDLAKSLWRSSDKKGTNLPLLRSSAFVLQRHDEMFEEEEIEREDDSPYEAVSRPLGLWYQFIEVCGGAGVVTKHLVELSVVCGPVLDLSVSLQYDLTQDRVIQWLMFMLEEKRLLSFLAAPPCTTFSPAAHPALRSYKEPMGFKRDHPRVLLGNRLAFSSMSLMVVSRRQGAFGLLETPLRSKMRWLRQWRRLIALGAEEAHLASCAYGSIHQKKFCFLGVNMKVGLLRRKCTGDHVHVRIQGKFTKPSATYCEGLAISLARLFRDHLEALRRTECRVEVATHGLEDLVSNDLCQSLRWSVGGSWKWEYPSHINVLETSAIYRALADAARGGGDCRLIYLCDSHVARASVARGRTSSDALRPLLRRISSLCVGYGLYPAGRFAPTRLNPADCPTRDLTLPPPSKSSILSGSDAWILRLPLCRRWASNWLRLVLLVIPSAHCFSASDSVRKSSRLPIALHEWTLDFDSTLGFPGEGPSLRLFLTPPLVAVLTVGPVAVFAVPRARGSNGDLMRQNQRVGLQLPDGRRVTETTVVTRDWLLQKFSEWLFARGTPFENTFQARFPSLDDLNKLLCEYGRFLFHGGKPYYHYAETINAVVGKRPTLRRSLQQAWDLAFMWCSYEPTEHHTGMPFQVLLAILSTCLVWGWKREAAIFALAWGALLRIGEVFHAFRKDIIFPADVAYSTDHILVRIKEPKTRYRAARHQSSKVEQPDLMQVVSMGLQGIPMYEKIWTLSGSSLRSRLTKVLQRLELPSTPDAIPRPLTLASLRAGGATWLISESENAELVRRRGRWVSMKVMEVYLQEVTASTFLNDISPDAKWKTLQAMHVFPDVVQKATAFVKSKIPELPGFSC